MADSIVTFRGSHGEVDFDAVTGAVVAYREDASAEAPAYRDYVRADFAERRSWYAVRGIILPALQPGGDVLDVGVWLADGSYLPAELDWRENFARERFAIA